MAFIVKPLNDGNTFWSSFITRILLIFLSYQTSKHILKFCFYSLCSRTKYLCSIVINFIVNFNNGFSKPCLSLFTYLSLHIQLFCTHSLLNSLTKCLHQIHIHCPENISDNSTLLTNCLYSLSRYQESRIVLALLLYQLQDTLNLSKFEVFARCKMYRNV